MGRVFAAIPVKSLSKSKSRLSSLLKPSERSLLTASMLRDVLNAVKNSMTVSDAIIVSPDMDVLKLADGLGVQSILQTGSGLNEAISQVVDWCLEKGGSSILILPSDIPLVTSEDINEITALPPKPRAVVISPSLDGGTNAMLQRPPGVIPPRYGSDSFRMHLDSAAAARVKTEVYRSPRVSLDIDSPEDLKVFLEKPSRTFTYRLLSELGFA
ncbi:2-phospho-L-lactate guanylyltransferase [Candidatus Bathyarchaeota archaeon]|nr:2-phospho-L-lactate guanylyltransferase [Candidatus Bathyarchaeota archaeon]